MKKWRLLGIVLVAFIVGVVGCPETQQMMKPIVTEPADTVVVGEVKEDLEEKPAEPEKTPATEQPTEEATDPAPPADTTPPTVVEVSWYGDSQRTEPLTADSTVRPGDTVYTVVVFSEPVVHTVADDDTARPALSIVADGMATQYKMLPHGIRFQSGEAKRLQGGTDDYLCKYTIPADTVGTLALRVGGSTADTAGNAVTETSEHTAPFMVTEPEPEQITLTLPPGFTLPPELIPTEPTVLSSFEETLMIIEEKYNRGATDPENNTTNSPADAISLLPYKDREEVYELFVASIDLPSFAEAAEKLKEISINLKILGDKARETGNKDEYRAYKEKVDEELGYLGLADLDPLVDIYFEENPEYSHLKESGEYHSRYWIILEYYRLQLENPKLPNFLKQVRPEELLKLFRESARKGYIFGLDNPWG